MTPVPRWFCAALLAATAYGQQVADRSFDTRVADPAFTSAHPRVGIDESHKNFHTKDGRYKPFAALMASDGFTVRRAEVHSGRAQSHRYSGDCKRTGQ